MKENCFDIGTIQAFLDGELASERLENVARHLALCDDCALQLATAEEETAFAFNALEHEFNSLVPTQRLWTKINESIERERKSFWKPILAFFRNPAMATFAAFLIVFGLFVAYLNSANNVSEFASVPAQSNPTASTLPVSVSPSITQNDDAPSQDFVKTGEVIDKKVETASENRKNYQIVNASVDLSKPKNAAQSQTSSNNIPKPQPAVYEYLPGEESYIKTIATLEKTIDEKKDEVLRPSSRVAYEKDIALVNDAIQKLQVEVKKNPKNEAAKQVLLASYQNKVDLLNSVAQKGELMASR